MNKLLYSPLFLMVGFANAELIGMDEDFLESVSGQTGLTVEMHKQIKVNEIRYSDKDGASGEILDFKDIVIGHPDDVNNKQAVSIHTIDVDGSDGLVIVSQYQATRLQIGSISVGNHRGSALDAYATRQSFGQIQYDWTGTNVLSINGKSAGDSGFIISSDTNITDSDFRWTTNGNTLQVNDMVYNSSITDMTLDVEDDTVKAYLALRMPTMSYDYNIGSICFSDVDCVAGNSFGNFAQSRAYKNSSIFIYGGGREGTGITMNMHFEFDDSVNALGDGNVTSYTDEATVKIAKQSGMVDIAGFTFDIGTGEAILGDHIAMQWDSVVGNFKSDLVEIAGKSVGAFEVRYDFSDGTHDSVDYKNQLKLAPGIAFAGEDFLTDSALVNAGFDTVMKDFYANVTNVSDGISLYNQWNMTADFIYTDDNHTVMADNFYAYGDGYSTLDIRDGSLSVDASNAGSDFLAIGIRNYKVNYGLDGLRVGGDTAELQNGHEMLGFFSDATFTLNGALEVRGGGASGSGINIDADMLITDGNFTLTKSNGIGIHLDDVSYEFHMRNMTMDVDNDGIKLVLGELWTEFAANDIRFGGRTTGESLGGIAMTQYQKGSEIVISGGGAQVNRCMRASGVDAAACAANGGTWIDTIGADGDEGLTIKHKQILLQENIAEGKSNSVTYETNRVAGVSGTGQSIKLNNIYTSDGYDDATNTFGVENKITVDVASAGTAQTAELFITNNVRFKELNVDSVQLIHGASSTSSNMLQGIKMQNVDFSSQLSVSPIP
ncbi:DUF6160 family protein [Bermanella sp. WJH001]|uniref:DUF6160 family protein n=1 Tax=Bermanella sp. WJH001 TaxID=3048005 RepID=UPI0024BE830A|nr:DUF6160 family protein [Bermanella sp. WJH001]MDJ1539523.1 hypothetical protein [Bermanella sp. WJH001]